MAAATEKASLPADASRRKWVKVLGHVGHVAKGIVYSVIGFLALMLAIGLGGGEATGAKGAIREIGNQAFGRVLLGLLAVGLLCYAAWRFAQALADTNDQGTDAKGIAVRIGYAVSGFIHLALGSYAGLISIGFSDLSGSGSPWTRTMTAHLGGQVAILTLGAIMIGVAIGQFYGAYAARFMEDYDTTSMATSTRKAVYFAGRFGLAARGVIFGIIGWFFIRSAIRTTSDGESGTSEALAAIASQTYGTLLLASIAAGVVAYSIHCFFQAIFRRFESF